MSIRKTLLFIILFSIFYEKISNGADSWSNLTPGVRYLHRTTSVPQSIHILFIDICDPGVSFRATSSSERAQVVSAFASSVGALAAINGDFFSFGSYTTVGLAVGNGERWGDTADSTLEGFVAFGEENRFVLSVPSAVIEPPEYWMRDVVSGRPLLVHDGVKITPTEPSHMFSRQPRTAIGWDEDNNQLIFMVVDGRQPGFSVGMDWEEIADTLISFGADEVLNLDGGGSSTMWINGLGVVNSPSDGSERVVANHLAVKWSDIPDDYPSLCCSSSVNPSADGVFKDLPTGHPARQYADALYEAGIIQGCQETPRLFCPDCRANRAVTITVILKAMGESPYFPSTPSFEDVPATHWAYGWIERAFAIGLTGGCSSSPRLFCPERTTTRAQLAVFVQRGSGISESFPASATFSDLSPSHWAYGSVEGLVSECLEIACNSSPMSFCPDRPITRTELVSFVAQAFDIGKDYGCVEEDEEIIEENIGENRPEAEDWVIFENPTEIEGGEMFSDGTGERTLENLEDIEDLSPSKEEIEPINAVGEGGCSCSLLL